MPLSANLRLLPEATLNWLCRHLDLSQHLQPGQELEVPAKRLNQYEVLGKPPDPANPLVKLHVMAPGWKRRGEIILSPRVIVAAPLPSAAPAGNPGTPERWLAESCKKPASFCDGTSEGHSSEQT